MTPERDKRQMAYNDSMASKDESLLQYTEDGDTLELDPLESHLWEAADILRGSIGAADYKNYIFGLLFLKRINDRFEEETLEIAEELTGDDEEPVRTSSNRFETTVTSTKSSGFPSALAEPTSPHRAATSVPP